MARPAAFRESFMFGGERREYTRQRLYRQEDADFDARLDVDDDVEHPDVIDPYAEAQYTALDETPASIAQFRADVAGSSFRGLIERRAGGTAVPVPSVYDTSERAARLRQAAILAAMANSAASENMYFSLAYARCVPGQYIREFLASTEVSSICAVLLPALYVRHERTRYHLEEGHWLRSMADRGAIFKRGDTCVCKGHLVSFKINSLICLILSLTVPT